MDDETESEKEHRLALENVCAKLGRTVGDILPEGVGFVMVLFDFGAKGSMAYMGNGNREDVIKMLGELRDKIRRQ